jgi:7-cyano-7-deazaguanine synthase
MSDLQEKAVLVFSGGQDSTTCLYWALNFLGLKARAQRQDHIFPITFNYGQRHAIELESAKLISKFAGLNYDEINIEGLLRAASSLTDTSKALVKEDKVENFKSSLPATFVPGRNLLFLSIAANIAYSKQAKYIITGVCETDFAGYYDCREEFVRAQEKAINQACFGKDEGFKILTPLMNLNKSESVDLLENLANNQDEFEQVKNLTDFEANIALETKSYENNLMLEAYLALAGSHTCYSGVYPPCGKCHACHLRANGFRGSKLADPLVKFDLKAKLAIT